MTSPAAPFCSRLACRIVGGVAVLLVMLGGLRLLMAAEAPGRGARGPAAAAVPSPTRPELVDDRPWATRAGDLATAVAHARITCGGAACGFDRIDPPLKPAWRPAPTPTADAAADRMAWVGEAAAPPPDPAADLLVPLARTGNVLLRPETLRVAF